MDNKTKFKPLVVIQSYEDRHISSKNAKRQEAPQEKSLTRQTREVELAPPPPPPPPPFDNSTNMRTQAKSRTPPPVPAKYSTLSYTKDEYPQLPPPCPTPDYDTISVSSHTTLTKASQNDLVEMESLESYTINNPNCQTPKPPSTYFNKPQLGARLSNGSTSSTLSNKKQRPVSVTIGEYPSGSLRRQPGKLDFLHNGSEESEKKTERVHHNSTCFRVGPYIAKIQLEKTNRVYGKHTE